MLAHVMPEACQIILKRISRINGEILCLVLNKFSEEYSGSQTDLESLKWGCTCPGVKMYSELKVE